MKSLEKVQEEVEVGVVAVVGEEEEVTVTALFAWLPQH